MALLSDAFPGSLFETTGTLDEGRRALTASSGRPIVLLDVNLPDSQGADGARELLRIAPGVKIIALSAEDKLDRRTRLLKHGVHGFLSKTIQPTAFIEKLSELIRSPLLASTDRSGGHAAHDLGTLSARQNSVLIEMARGRSNKEIAQSLGIGVETVKTHVSEIIRRLGVRNRAEAIHRFITHGGGQVGSGDTRD